MVSPGPPHMSQRSAVARFKNVQARHAHNTGDTADTDTDANADDDGDGGADVDLRLVFFGPV